MEDQNCAKEKPGWGAAVDQKEALTQRLVLRTVAAFHLQSLAKQCYTME